MLGGQDIDRPDRSTKLLKLPNHRGELDGFGTGTDYRKNLQLPPGSESDRGDDVAVHRKAHFRLPHKTTFGHPAGPVTPLEIFY